MSTLVDFDSSLSMCTGSKHSLISECIPSSLPIDCGMSLHKTCPAGNKDRKGKERYEYPIMSCHLWRRGKQPQVTVAHSGASEWVHVADLVHLPAIEFS